MSEPHIVKVLQDKGEINDEEVLFLQSQAVYWWSELKQGFFAGVSDNKAIARSDETKQFPNKTNGLFNNLTAQDNQLIDRYLF